MFLSGDGKQDTTTTTAVQMTYIINILVANNILVGIACDSVIDKGTEKPIPCVEVVKYGKRVKHTHKQE